MIENAEMIPSWVPSRLRELIDHGATRPAKRARLLAMDPKMVRVWQALVFNKLNTREQPPEWLDSRQERERRATEVLLAACGQPPQVSSEKEIEQFQCELRKVASDLESFAEQLKLLGRRGPSSVHKITLGLRSAIAECHVAADKAGKLPTVDRPSADYWDRVRRGYLHMLVNAMLEHFGMSLYHHVKTIASVVLEEEVTVKMVRSAAGTNNKGQPAIKTAADHESAWAKVTF